MRNLFNKLFRGSNSVDESSKKSTLIDTKSQDTINKLKRKSQRSGERRSKIQLFKNSKVRFEIPKNGTRYFDKKSKGSLPFRISKYAKEQISKLAEIGLENPKLYFFSFPSNLIVATNQPNELVKLLKSYKGIEEILKTGTDIKSLTTYINTNGKIHWGDNEVKGKELVAAKSILLSDNAAITNNLEIFEFAKGTKSEGEKVNGNLIPIGKILGDWNKKNKLSKSAKKHGITLKKNKEITNYITVEIQEPCSLPSTIINKSTSNFGSIANLQNNYFQRTFDCSCAPPNICSIHNNTQAWQDFSDFIFALEPQFEDYSVSDQEASLSQDQIETLEEVDNELNSYQYFLTQLNNAVFKGITNSFAEHKNPKKTIRFNGDNWSDRISEVTGEEKEKILDGIKSGTLHLVFAFFVVSPSLHTFLAAGLLRLLGFGDTKVTKVRTDLVQQYSLSSNQQMQYQEFDFFDVKVDPTFKDEITIGNERVQKNILFKDFDGLLNLILSGLGYYAQAELFASYSSIKDQLTKNEFFRAISRFFEIPSEIFSGESLSSVNLSNSFGICDFYFRLDNTIGNNPDLLYKTWDNITLKMLELFPMLEDYSFTPPVIPSYTFNPFAGGTFNLGLRLIYRMELRVLGDQRGEIVKTIPLGPKQTEKVSTKITKKTKISSTSESQFISESTSEQSDSTKTANELLNETAKDFHFNNTTNLKTEIPIKMVKLGVENETTFTKDTSQSSQEKRNQLNETVRKVASKIRRESKVTVSKESESSFERNTASEIYNPNDEVALTYVYSKLQRQYESFTQLAEIQDVVFIAEHIPAPEEINQQWVKRYDWILAKVLLDNSFSETLGNISEENLIFNDSDLEDRLDGVLTNTLESLKGFSSSSSNSISNIDYVGESQKGYRNLIKERLERQRQSYQMEAKRNRLYQHIRDNILHYCQAIWKFEDSQQRQLRYKRMDIKIPLNWSWSVGEVLNLSVEDLLNLPANETQTLEITYLPYSPETEGRQVVDLVDIIDSEPIGYYANYSIYRLKPELASNCLLGMLNSLKVPYISYPYSVNNQGLVEFSNDGISLTDPYLKKLLREFSIDDNRITSSDISQIKEDMIWTIPTLREMYEIATTTDDNNNNTDEVDSLMANNQLFIENYPYYVFRKNLSSRFILDTNNLVLDIIRGCANTLESFKEEHREMDVIKANLELQKLESEIERMNIENLRRATLVEQANLIDPDIDSITVIDANINNNQTQE